MLFVLKKQKKIKKQTNKKDVKLNTCVVFFNAVQIYSNKCHSFSSVSTSKYCLREDIKGSDQG